MDVTVSIKIRYNSRGTSVVVCTDLQGKEPHRQVGIGQVMTSGSLGGGMVNTLVRNARDMVSIPALGAIFPNFIIPMAIIF